MLHGETAVKKRQDLVRRFQEDEAVGFFVLSLKAGGAGLNLTAASHVVHFDRWWNPAVENQATDRAFRIGQTKNVLVHKFVCRGTVEEKIDELIESKRQLSQDLLEGGADLLLTEMKDDELLKLVALDHQQSAEGDMIDGLLTDGEPYVSVAAAASASRARDGETAKSKGHAVSPVVIEGRAIVKTFWGKAWCENLERYSDYANRLPRGRTYVRNGSVVDLQIAPGEIQALVSGSEIYEVALKVAPVAKTRWKSICTDCAGAIDSLVELLQGRFPRASWNASAGRRPACSHRPPRSSSHAVVRIGPTCASMWRRCCTASAHGWITSPNFSSGCTTWTRRNSSRAQARAFRRRKGRRLPRRCSVERTYRLSSDWTWLKALAPRCLAPPRSRSVRKP